jgi:site-specific recombinase XerD
MESLKANRAELWGKIPRYTELQEKIRDIDKSTNPRYQVMRNKQTHKPLLAIIMLTGARVSEVLALKKKDIVFTGLDGKELNNNYGPVLCSDVSMITITLLNEKSKKHPVKIIPISRYNFWAEAIDWIIYYYNSLEAASNIRLFTITRTTVWYIIKTTFGKDYFPHIFRHYAASNDTRAGVNPAIIKKKLGWGSLAPYDIYAHMNTNDITNEFNRVYGVSPADKYNLDASNKEGDSIRDILAKYNKDKRQFNTPQGIEKKKQVQEAVARIKKSSDDDIPLV